MNDEIEKIDLMIEHLKKEKYYTKYWNEDYETGITRRERLEINLKTHKNIILRELSQP